MAVAFYVGEILALGFKTGKQKISDRRERNESRYNTQEVPPVKNEEMIENNDQPSNNKQADISRKNETIQKQNSQNQTPIQNSPQPAKKTRSQIHAQKKREMNLRKSQNENKNTGENN